ncbi:hypothetical protein B_256 [Cronobacter phage vB_CsaM_leB]|uniref:Uncharacterized protein n=1 Tax=Cronobacter phage vB_CsaM_leB TaxID=1885242 RepID=A0A1W5N0R1_9CAUD|nr:hypothetical protein HWB00_gp256 [Cronobacter phage vB_CsaM_leB]AOG16382.1 hypothetical protein B_256 [Cronobacter phage vB_CsaM_leB]
MYDYTIERDRGEEWLISRARNFYVKLPKNFHTLPNDDTDRLLRILVDGNVPQRVFQEMVEHACSEWDKKYCEELTHDSIVNSNLKDAYERRSVYDIYEKERKNEMMFEDGNSAFKPARKTYPDWRKQYAEQLWHIDIPEALMKAISPAVDYYSGWKDEYELEVNGFRAHVIKATRILDFVEAVVSCDIVEDIRIPSINVSRYSSPGNIRGDRYANLASTTDKLNFHKINEKGFDGCVLISMVVVTTQGEYKLIIDCDKAARAIPTIKQCFGEDFKVLMKARAMEKFIHSCKKNVLEKYDPALTYTKIDKDLVGDLC